MNLRGVVLAGGLSRRFGRDKALADAGGGVTFLQRAVGLLRSFDPDPVVITCAGRDYRLPGIRFVQSDFINGKGPLGGLHTAFCLFPGKTLLVLACDMPFVTRRDLETLVAGHRAGSAATVFPAAGGRAEPFPGVYESRLAASAERRVSVDRLSIRGFLEVSSVSIVGAARRQTLRNINSPADFVL